MFKYIHSFVAFQHENTETKNNIINLARTQDRTKAEGALTATLIYANVIDYIAKHLLENLCKMTSIYTFQKFGGVFHPDYSKKKTNLPIGQLQNELQLFEFPQKEDFMDLLQEFKELRNQAMHNLMQLDPQDTTNKIDKDLERIVEIAEDILAKYNTISTGLVSIWNATNSI